MTVRELREVKRQLAEERQRADKAEADYETVRDTLESITASRENHVGNDETIRQSAEQFSEDIRALIRRHSYLEHYVTEFKYAEESVRREYQTTLDALYDFVDKLAATLGKSNSVIIDIK
jgi:chromosome segregation ATPase